MGTKSRFVVTFGLPSLLLLLLLPGMLSACGYGEDQSSPPPTPSLTAEAISPANTPTSQPQGAEARATATPSTLPTVAQAMPPEPAASEATGAIGTPSITPVRDAATPTIPASAQPPVGAVREPPLLPTPTEAGPAEATATELVVTVTADEPPPEESPIADRLAAPSPTSTSTPARRRAASAPTRTATPARGAGAVRVAGRVYDAYLQAATKKHQYYHYTCEFDAAWVVLKTYGFDVSLEDQLKAVGQDPGAEPYFKETKQGILIYGGDITSVYSGDYKENFLARSTGFAMRKVFEAYGLKVTAVNDRPALEAALLRGELVWMKTTVDFKSWRPATWIMPDGRTWKTVLGNDHAAVVIGFNKDVVVIRDVLGPTNTNYQRKYEYEVKWPTFMASWGAQSYDALAVAPPGP